jgi:hypothetical protein
MTRRERLIRLYTGKEVDRPGVYCRTGFPANDASYDKLKNYLGRYTELKFRWDSSQLEEKLPVETFTEEYSADYEKRVSILHTPKGDLRESVLKSLKGEPGLHKEHFIKNREDIEKYLSLPLPEITCKDFSSFRDMKKEINDSGIAEVSLGLNPAGRAAVLLGSEKLAIMSVEDRDLIHELCKRETERIIKRLKCLLEKNIGPFFSMLGEEYVAPPLHGPKDFWDFNVRYDKQIIDLTHQGKGFIHIHCHGSIKKVIDGFLEMGADVLHPFEHPPFGDITAKEAKNAFRDRVCLEGNIPIEDMYQHTPEQIYQETSDLIDDCFDDSKGLIVCPTASPYLRGRGEDCYRQFVALITRVREITK